MNKTLNTMKNIKSFNLEMLIKNKYGNNMNKKVSKYVKTIHQNMNILNINKLWIFYLWD